MVGKFYKECHFFKSIPIFLSKINKSHDYGLRTVGKNCGIILPSIHVSFKFCVVENFNKQIQQNKEDQIQGTLLAWGGGGIYKSIYSMPAIFQ